MVESVKWVDVVLRDVPYDVNERFMQELFEVRAAAERALRRASFGAARKWARRAAVMNWRLRLACGCACARRAPRHGSGARTCGA